MNKHTCIDTTSRKFSTVLYRNFWGAVMTNFWLAMIFSYTVNELDLTSVLRLVWCGVRLKGKRGCRYSRKRFELAPARWRSGWITQVNIEGALAPRVYQDSDPYAPTLRSLIHRCESRAWDGKTIQVYWGLQDFLFFLTKLFYKHFFLFLFNFLSDMPHTQ